MRKVFQLMFVFLFVCILSASGIFALTWKHSGTSTMILDDEGDLWVLGNITSDGIFVGDGSGLTNVPTYNVSYATWLDNYTAYNSSWSLMTNTSYVTYTGAIANVDLGSYNLTASYLFGDGSGLTNTPSYNASYATWLDNYTAYNSSWSSTYNASYVPYTGATGNVTLGNYNLTAGYFFGNGSQLTGVVATSVADGSITAAKIVADSINTTHILDGQVQTGDIADGNVTSSKIESVDWVKLNSKLVDGIYLLENASEFLVFNETKLNLTIDAKVLALSDNAWTNNSDYIYTRSGYPTSVNISGNLSFNNQGYIYFSGGEMYIEY